MYNQKALKVIKNHLFEKYPDIIEKMILFGSRVKGNEIEESDYDILLILKSDYDWKLKENIRDTIYDIALEYDIITNTMFINKDELESVRGSSPFIQEALINGIKI